VAQRLKHSIRSALRELSVMVLKTLIVLFFNSGRGGRALTAAELRKLSAVECSSLADDIAPALGYRRAGDRFVKELKPATGK
jgi:hypothetical protein